MAPAAAATPAAAAADDEDEDEDDCACGATKADPNECGKGGKAPGAMVARGLVTACHTAFTEAAVRAPGAGAAA
jgi:hypothetical protein